jgi:NAD(P)-dependent dehydrogenase (short-subunit alcohol dehydrogenase family)
MTELRLDGKVVAITGAARGIGFETAKACAAAGMKVALGDLDQTQAADAAAKVASSAGGYEVDVRDRGSFIRFLDAAEEDLGALDVLVNNAGVFFLGPFAEESPEHTERMLAVNLGGVLCGSQLAVERFGRSGGGHIVNIASSAGQIAPPGGATYAATKHAVVGFTRALRGEVRDAGIRTTIVMPGIIKTEMIGGFAKTRGTRIIEPDAVADGIVDALRKGKQEIFVPRELGPMARVMTALPPKPQTALLGALGADKVMVDADHSARSSYEKRAESE